MLSLRPYQDDAIARVDDAEARGIQRPIVAMATGLGKTVVFSHILKRRGGRGRGLVLAHRDELVRQAAEKVGMVTGLRCGIVKAGEDDVQADVVIASVQTLARPARLERLLRGGDLFHTAADFATVIVDEVHHYLAGEEGNTFGRVLDGLGSMTAGGPLTVGFTATPERSDGSVLGETWQEIAYQLGILDGIRGGWLCDIKAKQIKLAGADFNKLHVRAGEIRENEAADMLMEADAPKHAAEAYLQHAKGRKALVFTPTVAVAKAMAEAFRAVGVPAESVDGEMDMEARRAVLRRLATGETLVVPNAQVLTEGFDEPSISCVIMARPSRSRPFVIQCIGRGTRLYPGKADCLVLDLVGSATRMDLVTVASLFDVSPTAAEQGIGVATAGGGAGRPQRAEPEGAHLVSIDVALFDRSAMNWQSQGMRFALSLADQQRSRLVVEPGEAGKFNVYRLWREKAGKRWLRGELKDVYEERREAKYVGLDFGYALGAAEDLVRKAGAMHLNAKDAPWRHRPATPKQIEILTRKRKYRDGMTAGEASDVIGRCF